MALPNEIHPFLVTGNDPNQYKMANSLRFRSSASAYLSRTPGSASDQKKWTFSAWVKRGSLGSTQIIAQAGSGGTNFTYIALFNSSDQLVVLDSTVSGVSSARTTTAVFRDPSAWYHISVYLDAANTTSKVYVNNVEQTCTGTQPSNQNWAVNSAIEHRIGRAWAGNTNYFDGYLAEVNFIDGQALTPSSFGQTDNNGVWVPKRYTGTYGTNGFYLPFKDNSSTTTLGYDVTNGTGALTTPYAASITTNNSGWDTLGVRMLLTTGAIQQQGKSFRITLKSGSNGLNIQGVKFGVKASSGNAWDFTGDQVSVTFGGATTYSLGSNSTLTSDWMVYPSIINPSSDYILALAIGTTNGTTLSGSATTGSIRNYTKAGDYNSGALTTAPTGYSDAGTAAYFLTALEVQGNNWTPSGISVTSGVTYDSMIDSPTTYDDGSNIYNRGNYCTMNPLTAIACTPAQGNLYVSTTNGFAIVFCSQTLPSTGKLYWEFTNTSASVLASQRVAVGFALASTTTPRGSGSNYFGGVSGDVSYLGFNGSINGVVYATWTTNDVIGIAIDCFTGNYWFAVNNSWQNSGNPSAGTGYIGTLSAASTLFCPVIGNIANANGYDMTGHFNFGQRPFSYTPPTGFKALNSYNLANPSLPLV